MELFDLGPALSSKSVVLFESFHQLTVTTVPVSNLGTWRGWSLNHIGQTSTDHILKEVFCKTRFPSIEQKEACFNISKKFKMLVGDGWSKGLHLGQVGFLGFSLVSPLRGLQPASPPLSLGGWQEMRQG